MKVWLADDEENCRLIDALLAMDDVEAVNSWLLPVGEITVTVDTLDKSEKQIAEVVENVKRAICMSVR